MLAVPVRGRFGGVAKWTKARVCKTRIHRFESDRRLFFCLLLPPNRKHLSSMPSAGWR